MFLLTSCDDGIPNEYFVDPKVADELGSTRLALVSSPTNGCSLELCIPFLKLTNKDQASISWKPGPLAANVTRNMIGAAANSYIHVVGSQ